MLFFYKVASLCLPWLVRVRVRSRVGGSADRSVVKDRNVSDNADITVKLSRRGPASSVGRRSRSPVSERRTRSAGRSTEVGAHATWSTRGRARAGTGPSVITDLIGCVQLDKGHISTALILPFMVGLSHPRTPIGRSITPAHSNMHPATAVRDTPALKLK